MKERERDIDNAVRASRIAIATMLRSWLFLNPWYVRLLVGKSLTAIIDRIERGDL